MARARVRYHLNDRLFRAINAKAPVRVKVRQVAGQVAALTRSRLAAANSDGKVSIDTGTRRDGRAYSRVSHDDKIGEYGAAGHPRHRALGRSAGEV